MAKRLLSEPVKKIVAHRQGWRCAGCSELLPPSYQIDHIVALCDGGADVDLGNLQAMCGTCHANKTQREIVERMARAKAPRAAYEDREDVRVPRGWRCTLCFQTRPYSAPHDFCMAIEDPGRGGHARQRHLSAFAFVPRVNCAPRGRSSPC